MSKKSTPNRLRYQTHLHSQKDGYAKYAKTYDKTATHLDSFEKGALKHLIGPTANKSILDLGAGTGRVFDLLRKANTLHASTNLTAIDISPEMLEILKKKHPKAEAIEADLNKALPFQAETFDIATAAFAIVHLKKLDDFFGEVYRILKPNGEFILTNINQRKAPKLETHTGEKIVITSYYHIPDHVIEALEKQAFKIESESFVEEDGMWINQIIKARK